MKCLRSKKRKSALPFSSEASQQLRVHDGECFTECFEQSSLWGEGARAEVMMHSTESCKSRRGFAFELEVQKLSDSETQVVAQAFIFRLCVEDHKKQISGSQDAS